MTFIIVGWSKEAQQENIHNFWHQHLCLSNSTIIRDFAFSLIIMVQVLLEHITAYGDRRMKLRFFPDLTVTVNLFTQNDKNR